MQRVQSSYRVSFFGGGWATGNRGVEALTQSFIDAFLDAEPQGHVDVYDHEPKTADDQRITVIPARWSKRIYRKDSIYNITLAARIAGGLGTRARRLLDSAAIVDVSGGDSFSDIYGQQRFDRVVTIKKTAISRGVPLVLLPQTYGPYRDQRNKDTAAHIVQNADTCWARDERSYDILKDLLGTRFNPERHRCGVDMAFALKPREPNDLPDQLRQLTDRDTRQTPVIGFNISGLIYSDPNAARERYGFRADYRAVVSRFLDWALNNTDASIILIPHVNPKPGIADSDPQACEDAAEQLRHKHAGRIHVAPSTLSAQEAKWLIGTSDWFCGTRMHSTIASLSSRVPTATVSYSDKALGVFETCGQGGHVFDPRQLDTDDTTEHLKASFNDRNATKQSLEQHMPIVQRGAVEQMNAIAERLRTIIADRGAGTAA